MNLYNFPSIDGNHKIIGIFKSISNHYTCVSGYDYEKGSFRGKTYRIIIKTISGLDIEEILTSDDCFIIYNKLTEFINTIQQKNWIEYYYMKYPNYKHNYPINVSNHYDIIKTENTYDSDYYISSSELSFLQILFKLYYENKLFLIPKYQ